MIAVTIGITACGGSSHKSSTTSTTKKTTSGPAKPVKAVKKALPPLTLDVEAAQPGGSFGRSLKASVGQQVAFRVQAAGIKNGQTATLTLNLAAGPANKLLVTAKIPGHSAKVTISGAPRKKLTLQSVHFACDLPPVPTLCPPRAESSSKAGFHLAFKVSSSTPIIVGATVGPGPIVPARSSPSNAVVPAYTVTEEVRTIKFGTTPSLKPVYATTATAAPKDTVVLLTRVAGLLKGAPQTVTITIDQGPAATLTASARVAGGKPSIAMIKSAGGSPIAIVLPHYTCFVTPTATACPATSTKVEFHKYVLTFSLTPYSPPLAVVATAQAG